MDIWITSRFPHSPWRDTVHQYYGESSLNMLVSVFLYSPEDCLPLGQFRSSALFPVHSGACSFGRESTGISFPPLLYTFCLRRTQSTTTSITPIMLKEFPFALVSTDPCSPLTCVSSGMGSWPFFHCLYSLLSHAVDPLSIFIC
jgi:hypothetical protein